MLPMIKAKYNARACGAASLANAKSGNTQVAVPFEVTDGEHAGEHISWIGTFAPTTADRTIESLFHMGWQGDDVSELCDITDEQAMALMPNVVQLVCEPDVYDGKTTLKVQWVNKAGGGRFAFKEPLSTSDTKAFAAQMRNTIRAVRAQGGAQRNGSGGAKPKQPHPNAPDNGDDNPFASCDMRHEPSAIARVLR